MQPENPSGPSNLNILRDTATRRIESKRALALSGLRGGGKAWLLSALIKSLRRPLVVVCPDLRQAENLCEDLDYFSRAAEAHIPVHLFPPWDTVPYDGFSPNKEVIARRFTALGTLLSGEVMIMVTTPQAWMQGMIPPAVFKALQMRFEVGQSYPRGDLLRALLGAGYQRVDLVEAPGEFSARGEIVDLFPVQSDHPVRLDFFGDELESMRLFQVESQKSFQDATEIVVYPASEVVVNEETAQRALSKLPHQKAMMQPEYYRQVHHYLKQVSPFPGCEQMLPLFYESVGWLAEALPANTLIALDEPGKLRETARNYHGEVLGEFELNLNQGQLSLPPDDFYLDPKRWTEQLSRTQQFTLESLRVEGGTANLVCPFADNLGLRVENTSGNPHQIVENIIASVRDWQREGAAVCFAARSDTGAERLRNLLAEFDLGALLEAPSSDAFLPLSGQNAGDGELAASEQDSPRDLVVLTRAPNQGFRVVDEAGNTRFALITEEELLGEKTRQRRLKKSNLQHFLASLGELKEGDTVVHIEYGIGRYEGLRKLDVAGEEGDFLVLQYAGDDKVYVPVYKFNQVQKFTGVDTAAPTLNKLGDGIWQRSKQRATRAVEDMAEELVTLYAARKVRMGHAFDINEGHVTEFEEAFPFQETEDQARAIEDVLGDMGRELPMDRLVCGDVGFGKTEVAIRAAYVAALGGKQALILVPTTILAQQHYETFSQRCQGFPVRVEVISRFKSAREQKEIAAAFTEGQVDILIGTHRLFSKDIQPKDLGLLVIDEEQRFGVGHKEKIKKLRTQVDVLTLSATPIPRTLHMSLMGVRDLSIINTPPMDRVAVRTRLVKSSDYIITEAMEREIRRGGQVFLVHNKVETIHQFGNYAQSLAPHLRIAVAHGQMPEKKLEEVMLAFIHGEVDILLSTSIIESGLDIPRANTIIINNADAFGLSQLYQMRGRVGRSNVQAYAYLLVSGDKVLTEVAQKRLTLLSELNDLGSGFKIASHDLEIRGAGNLLGREQSGHINTIGLELFTQMVEEAVARLKGEDALTSKDLDCKLDLGFPYLLPETYISSTQQRLEIYKQLADVRSADALWELRQVMEDRFGAIPAEMSNLFTLIAIRLQSARYGLTNLERVGGKLQARFGKPELVDVEQLMQLVNNPEKGFRIQPDDRLFLGKMPETPEGVLERLKELETVVAERAA